MWSFVPALSENFLLYQPWIVAYFLAKVILDVALARQAYWDTRMRWFDLGLKGFGIVLVLMLLTGPEMFGLNPAYLALHNSSAVLINSVKKTFPEWNTGFRIYLFIQLIVIGILSIRDLFRIYRGQDNLKLRLQ